MTSSSPRLAAADRLLLRSVFAWARANGWRASDDNELSNRDWCPAGDEPNVFVNLYRPNYGDNGEDRVGNSILRVYFFGGAYRCVQVPSPSVREAVDVLVALDILPSELSSQYRTGANDIFAALTADDPQIITDAVAIALASKAVGEV